MPNPQHLTERLFQSPSKYIQGPNAIKNAPKYLKSLGKTPILIVDNVVYKVAGEPLIQVLEDAHFTVTHAVFGGEASVQEVTRLTNVGRNAHADFVIGLGGGKTIDTAKAIANQLGIQVAILPTVASTDAPCSALSVLYTPKGEFDKYTIYDSNPTIVLVDTSIIVRAPPRFLAAGIGDALATHVEARRCRNNPNPGGLLPTYVSEAIGQKCEEILFKYGKQAYEANKVQACTPAFEAVVEANTLCSGLGFESGGVAAAHSIHNGLTAIPALHSLLHGEKVAFGIVCQLVLDGADSAELERYISLMLSVNLPVTFEQLGIPQVTDQELRAVAAGACAQGETIWCLERAINEDIVFHAIKGANAASVDYIKRMGRAKL